MSLLTYIGPGTGGPPYYWPPLPVTLFLMALPFLSLWVSLVVRRALGLSLSRTLALAVLIQVAVLLLFVGDSGYHYFHDYFYYESGVALLLTMWPAVVLFFVLGALLSARLTRCVERVLHAIDQWDRRRANRALAVLTFTVVAAAAVGAIAMPTPFVVFAAMTLIALVAFALDELISLEEEARMG